MTGNKSPWFYYGLIMTRVIELVACVILGYFLGKYLDTCWGTFPYLMTGLIFLGFIGGIIRLIYSLSKFKNE